MPTVNDPNGYPLSVTEKGFALVYAASMPIEAHASDDGDCYTVVIEANTGGAACDFFYLKNQSDLNLRIYTIKAKSHTLDTEVQIKVGLTGDPSGGVEIVPVNALVGSGQLAEVVCEERATGDLDLTGGSIFDRLFLDASIEGEQGFHYSGEISLMKNQSLVLHAPVDTGGNVNLTIYFYFHEQVG